MKKQITQPHQEEQTLKLLPMLTSDGVKIELNTPIYMPEWVSKFGFHGGAEFKIKAYRVFYVNNSARVFRIRSESGIEKTFNINEGNSKELYGKVDSVKKFLIKKADHDIKKCKDKIVKVKKTWANVSKQYSKINKIKTVALPKAVK